MSMPWMNHTSNANEEDADNLHYDPHIVTRERLRLQFSQEPPGLRKRTA